MSMEPTDKDGQCLERQINVRNQGVTVKNQTGCDLTWYTHAGNSPLLRTAEHASPNAILIKSVTVCLIAAPPPNKQAMPDKTEENTVTFVQSELSLNRNYLAPLANQTGVQLQVL